MIVNGEKGNVKGSGAPSKLIRIPLFTFSFLLFTHLAQALIGEVKKDPTDMLKQYLALDERGARLDAISFETLKPYIDWKEEPAWGHSVVISQVKVIDDVKQWEILGPIDVFIPVEFTIVGHVYWDSVTFILEPHTEVIKFHVKGIKDRWRIVDPILPPHVGIKHMLNRVRLALAEEKDGTRLATLTALREDLQKLK